MREAIGQIEIDVKGGSGVPGGSHAARGSALLRGSNVNRGGAPGIGSLTGEGNLGIQGVVGNVVGDGLAIGPVNRLPRALGGGVSLDKRRPRSKQRHDRKRHGVASAAWRGDGDV